MTAARRALPWFALPLGGFTVLMTSLAAGAAWSVLGLYVGRPLAPLALPVGAAIGSVLRLQGLGGRWWSVLLALAACGVACVYAATLNATADVAGVLGLSMGSALPRIGTDMALAVAWARADAWQLGWAVLGAVAAGAFSLRGHRSAGGGAA